MSFQDGLPCCDSGVMNIDLLDNDENLLESFSSTYKYELCNSQEAAYVVNQQLFHAASIN